MSSRIRPALEYRPPEPPAVRGAPRFKPSTELQVLTHALRGELPPLSSGKERLFAQDVLERALGRALAFRRDEELAHFQRVLALFTQSEARRLAPPLLSSARST